MHQCITHVQGRGVDTLRKKVTDYKNLSCITNEAPFDRGSKWFQQIANPFVNYFLCGGMGFATFVPESRTDKILVPYFWGMEEVVVVVVGC